VSVFLFSLGRWLFAFACTQAVEVPLYLRATGSWRVSFGASALTHPVVWFVFPFLPLPYWQMVGCAEVFAVVVEAGWLSWHRVARPGATSLLANGASFAAGLVLRGVFGAP
jgi:hypothetical protein